MSDRVAPEADSRVRGCKEGKDRGRPRTSRPCAGVGIAWLQLPRWQKDLFPFWSVSAIMAVRTRLRPRDPRSGHGWTGGGIDWAALGVDPRWVGMESSDCAAALKPGIYHSEGARERDRYIAGAARRGETAVLVSTIGDADSTRRNPLSVYDASVSLSLESGSVCGRRLPQGAAVGLAGDLNRADRDLALRLKNRPVGAWWSLKLEASEVVFDGGGGPLGAVGPDGNLAPILTDGLGDPVVAVWTSPELDLRWYIIPYGTDWPMTRRVSCTTSSASWSSHPHAIKSPRADR